MPRDIPVGNGSLLVCFDQDYTIRDLYFPHVGQENHLGGRHCRFGVWAVGRFSWVGEGWQVDLRYEADTLVSRVSLYQREMGILLVCRDAVDFHENIYLREIEVQNMLPEEREIRLFFVQDFAISGNSVGDTAAFDPETGGVVHYKGSRYFLANGTAAGRDGSAQFAVGQKEVGGREGTFRDAEDGILSGNAIAQGSVDSVLALTMTVAGMEHSTAYYWLSAGKTWQEVRELDALVQHKRPGHLIRRTADYWGLWVRKETPLFGQLPDKVAELYRRSLLILRTQIDGEGGILAANDSDVILFNRDTYSYVWPRDGALVANALDLAGYPEVSQDFFRFVARIIDPRGYLLHKYNPDGTPASSWHPWFADGKSQLPIQEDETALVVWALWHHFVLYRDIEFIKPLYRPLIKRTADFICSYRDPATGLPAASYDLWEERRGMLSYTVGAVFGGLTAASLFCTVFGENERADRYRQVAAEIRDAASRHLWREELGRFCRMLSHDEHGELVVDGTCDASLWGLFAFGLYKADDPRIEATINALRDKLWVRTPVGGMARYEDDGYQRVSTGLPGNPWFIATLWLVDHLVMKATCEDELAEAAELLSWVADHALPSGVLAEQVHPVTGKPVFVSPLTWSHGTFIASAQRFMRHMGRIKSCPECGLPLTAESRREDWIEKMFGEACDAIHGICRV
ncbi:MAG TPA: glycoside hydrolase family 15 protein [Geobacteraceae bacterium]|nr:glycoside hydrolase family 15 protein [Geobacteraceae bacterium]